ncbi:MFS transporter [Kitasatospora sp. NPDC090091]|uniref:MFS transporter n=1 Tax=Kitasatospora sp. NPDC090091 TaxID=3364081 RepID=UPI003802F4CA
MSRDARGGLLRRHRDFRLLWCGETAGRFGSSVTAVALPLIAVADLHASTFQIGLLSAAAWVPWLVIGLPVGAWVDRLPRRPIMLASAAASLLLFATVPVAAWLDALSVGLLLAVALLVGTAGVFFQTAYTAYLPGLVGPADQAEGNAKLHGSGSAAQLAGLGSGGLIAQAAGAANGMFANAVTFLVSLVCLSRIRYREAPVPRRERALGREVAQGLRLIAGDVWLRTFVLHGSLCNMVLMSYQAIQIVFLVERAHLGEGAIGTVLGLAGAGGIAGAAVARRTAAAIGTARAMLLFQLGLPTLALLIPLTGPGAGVACYVVGAGAVAAGVVAGNILRATFQQSYVPADLRGRVSASGAFLNYGTIPVGALAGGALATAFGVGPAMWLATAAVPLAAATLFLCPLARLRDLPDRPAPRLTADPAGVPAGSAH